MKGLFYGPKLEYVLRDAIGRDWQCGTLQVDFNLPGRLGSFYIGSDGEKHVPVMLHRAIFGSLERFTGILIEHYAGRLPLWISPTQIAIVTINSQCDQYANNVLERCVMSNLRAETDLRNEKISYKIREHISVKIPILFVIGQKRLRMGQSLYENWAMMCKRLLSSKTQYLKLKIEQILQILTFRKKTAL